MTAANIRFGVEIETNLPTSNATPIGQYHNGLPVAWLEGWKVERDGSIRCPMGRKPAEFVSPVMQGADGIAQIRTACERITANGGRVNDSCGIHVTVSFDGDTKALARLINLVANHEAALFASTGTKRRELGRFCKGLKGYGAENAKPRLDRDRYHVLNLTHVANGRNRVEFRVFSGSLNAEKITAWVQLCLALVELATTSKRAVPWDYEAAKGPWHRDNAGRGEVELNRLFYRLGWIKGHAAKAYGQLDNIETAKATLRRLAQKYDTAA